MVRVNLINPKKLSDQHLIAEYNEILMLVSYIQKHPSKENIPKNYTLGKGHMLFFKDKVRYLKQRHENLKKEMRARGFKTAKTILLGKFKKNLVNDWKPQRKDKEIIKTRILEKLMLKPQYYRYYGKPKNFEFFFKLLD